MKKDRNSNDLRRRQQPEVVHTVADLRDLMERLEQRAAILRSIDIDLLRRYGDYSCREAPPEKLRVGNLLVVPNKAVVCRRLSRYWTSRWVET
jgi:phosphoribosyl-dephospho-CoA transferase